MLRFYFKPGTANEVTSEIWRRTQKERSCFDCVMCFSVSKQACVISAVHFVKMLESPEVFRQENKTFADFCDGK